jgi:hypothetical protein
MGKDKRRAVKAEVENEAEGQATPRKKRVGTTITLEASRRSTRKITLTKKAHINKERLNNATTTATMSDNEVPYILAPQHPPPKLELSEPTVDHLEPPIKQSWSDSPDVEATVQGSQVVIKKKVWHEPTPVPEPPVTVMTSGAPDEMPESRAILSPSLSAANSVPTAANPVHTATNPIPTANNPPLAAVQVSTTQRVNRNPNTIVVGPMFHYFGYSNDLSPLYIEHLCPGSVFISVAKLPGFKWTIGTRGYPIIVPSPAPDALVYGMLYAIPNEFMDTLHARALKRGAIPTNLTVDIYVKPLPSPSNFGWGYGALGQQHLRGQRVARVCVGDPHDADGVLLSGEKGDALIMRLNRGFVEAIMEGFPDEYVLEVFRKWIPYPKTPVGIIW